MCAAPRDYNVHKLVYEYVNIVISRYCKQMVLKELSFVMAQNPKHVRLVKFK